MPPNHLIFNICNTKFLLSNFILVMDTLLNTFFLHHHSISNFQILLTLWITVDKAVSSLPGAFNNSQIPQQSSQYNNFMQHHAQQQVYSQPWTQQINSPLTPQHNASSTEAIVSAVWMSMNSSGSLEPVETLKLLDIWNDLPQVSTRPPSPSRTIIPQSLVQPRSPTPKLSPSPLSSPVAQRTPPRSPLTLPNDSSTVKKSLNDKSTKEPKEMSRDTGKANEKNDRNTDESDQYISIPSKYLKC